MPRVSPEFGSKVQLEMKRVMGRAFAKLFLLLGHVCGQNKPVDQMVVQASRVVPKGCVDSNKFVDLV